MNVQFKKALQNCQTGWHIRDVGLNTLTPEDVATEAAEWAQTQFIKTLSIEDQVLGVDAVNLVTKEGHAVSFSNVAGQNTGGVMPSFITVPISLKGSIRRRYGNGRMLWPMSTPAFLERNSLNAAGVTLYQQAIDDLVSRYMDGPLFGTQRLVHLHAAMPAYGSRPALPATWYDITSIRLNTSLSALRRRKVGVGS